MIYSERLARAINIAATAHSHQQRRDKRTPYMTHPYSVAMLVRECGGDEDTVIAALFHDIIEDVPDKYAEVDMIHDFGEHVHRMVRAVTEDKNIPNFVDRKRAYLEQIHQGPAGAVLVSACDLLHNMISAKLSFDDEEPLYIRSFAHNAQGREAFWRARISIFEDRLPDQPELLGQLKHYYQILRTAPEPVPHE